MLQNKFIKNCYQKKYGLFLSSRFRHPCGAGAGATDQNLIAIRNPGEMAEWSNAAVSKTVVLQSWDRGFESPSLRKAKIPPFRVEGIFIFRQSGAMLA